jgi:hypothetical protein
MDRARDRVDRLARALAAAPTRRGLATLLAAAAAAVIAGRNGNAAAGNGPGVAAKKTRRCRPKCLICQECKRGRCKNAKAGTPCAGGAGSCSGGICLVSVPMCGTGGPCRVFVSSTSRPGGEIGGLAGGDALCQSLADAAALGGTYRAWLSAGADSPATRFSGRGTAGPYELVANADDGGNPPPTVAASFADVTTCDAGSGDCLRHAIDRDEFGVAVGTRCVWTGTRTDGFVDTTPDPEVFGDRTCRDWNDATNGSTGSTGGRDLKDSGWTSLDRGSCSFACRLYCFEQA